MEQLQRLTIKIFKLKNMSPLILAYEGFGGKMSDNNLLVFWLFLTHFNIFPSFKNENLILIVLITYFVQIFDFLTKIQKFFTGKNQQFFVAIQK